MTGTRISGERIPAGRGVAFLMGLKKIETYFKWRITAAMAPEPGFNTLYRTIILNLDINWVDVTEHWDKRLKAYSPSDHTYNPGMAG